MRTNKIPNKLTFPAALLGFVLQGLSFACWGTSVGDMFLRAACGIGFGIAGWFTGVLVMSVIKFFLRKMGHGDSKLVGAVGSFLGAGQVLIVHFWYALVFGMCTMLRLAPRVPWYQIYLRWNVLKSKDAAKSLFAPAAAEKNKFKKFAMAFSVYLDDCPTGPDWQKYVECAKQPLPVAPYIAIGTYLAVFLYAQTVDWLIGPPPS